jgi:hypothetical protein
MSEKDNEWTTVDTSTAGNVEEEKVEFEVEGEEQPELPLEQEKVQEVKSEESQPEQEEQQSGAQKRIRQLVRQKKEREEKIEQLVARQKELEEQLKTKQKEIETSVEKSFESAEQNVNSRMELARDAYRQALESGDTDRIVAAQEHLSKAQNDASMLQMNKQQFVVDRPVEEQAKPVQEDQSAQYDRLAVEWAGRNSWFGQDSVMTTLALEIDSDLKNEGYDPSEVEFYQEIDSRLRQKFPERFGVEQQRQQETSSPAQVVGGASRTSTASSNKKVKLSQEDVRLANKWGIPLEQYAAEKLKVERADGEYTSVYGK